MDWLIEFEEGGTAADGAGTNSLPPVRSPSMGIFKDRHPRRSVNLTPERIFQTGIWGSSLVIVLFYFQTLPPLEDVPPTSFLQIWQSLFDFPLKILALDQIRDLVIVVLTFFLLPAFLLLHALVALRQPPQTGQAVWPELVQDARDQLGEVLVLAVAVDGECVAGDRCMNYERAKPRERLVGVGGRIGEGWKTVGLNAGMGD